MSATDLRTALDDLFDAMGDAWNRADNVAFADLFVDDADFVEIRGGHHVGREAIRHGHQALWDSVYAGSSVRFDVETVRHLDDRAAVAIIGSTMVAPTGPLTGTNHSRITAVVTSHHDRLRIASFHNTLVMPEPSGAR
jgi:uncharacterized protein (TIGR02246 family)